MSYKATGKIRSYRFIWNLKVLILLIQEWEPMREENHEKNRYHDNYRNHENYRH